MTKQVRDADYLADIQTAIAKVNRYTHGMDLDGFIALPTATQTLFLPLATIRD